MNTRPIPIKLIPIKAFLIVVSTITYLYSNNSPKMTHTPLKEILRQRIHSEEKRAMYFMKCT